MRVGRVGDTYEFSASGKRLAGTDKQTFDELLVLSATWPDTYHQHVDCSTYVSRWAHRGVEVNWAALPLAVRNHHD